MIKIYKNVKLLDIENDTLKSCDIVVENGKIVSFDSSSFQVDEIIDLENNIVLPSFVNNFCDSFKAYKNSVGGDFDAKVAADVCLQKNICAGAVFVNDMCVSNAFKSKCLEDFLSLSDKQLNEFSNEVAKNKNLLFLKVGQTLEELGGVDKMYNKPLAQVLEDYGFLDRKAIVVGGNCLEKDELQLLKTYDVDFVLTPTEDGRKGRRPTNLVALRHQDFAIGLGGGEFLEVDFFAFMRGLIMNMRSLFEDEKVINESDVLEIAVNGKILGVNNKIEVGNFANFIVIKSDNIDAKPIKSLVWSKSKQDVVMSVFKGQILQKNGQILMKF